MEPAEASHRCEECGATYPTTADSCQARFDELLALDHSRREPWGSRHALAFAAFALQLPHRFPAPSISRAHELIERVCLHHEPLEYVINDYRARPRRVPKSPPAAPPTTRFEVTILDLGGFDAATYPEDLLRWARAALGVSSVGDR